MSQKHTEGYVIIRFCLTGQDDNDNMKALDKALWNIKDVSDNVVGTRFLFTEQDMTPERLEETYRIVAKMVKVGGKVYLPIFERLHSEIQSLKENQSMLDYALKVADLD